MLVDITVTELPGVESSTTDHCSGRSVVMHSEDVIAPEEIAAAVAALGYVVSVSE
jgi:hypothetical protein